MSDGSVIRIKPYYFIHVLDNNTNVTRVEVGPQTFTRQEHEKVVSGPDAMVMIAPRNYCIISNPVAKNQDGRVLVDEHGQIKLKHGDEEIRFEQEPFPLYPGEKMLGKVNALQVVAPNAALRLRAIRDFEDENKVKHVAGDEWLFEGPGTYYPRVEVQVVEIARAIIIKPNQALKLRAKGKACIDRTGTERKAGEEWLIRRSGSYLPGVDEEVVETVNSYILTDKKALHLKALKTFVDVFGKERKAGEEWLVTAAEAEVHIPDVYEQVVGEVKITALNNRQYCVVVDPVGPNGKPQLGQKQLRKGEATFFLRPGESLENGIQNVHVLAEEEALLLRAKEAFVDEKEKHNPGDRWMIYGPCDYVPPVQVEIVEKRTSIPLDENEGIYVRDIKTGEVKSVLGSQSYMLKPNEELWAKELQKGVEELLAKERADAEDFSEGRDKTRVVTYRAPHNSAVQIYDYKNKKSRVVFGPELVMLGPDEHFTVLSLSGDKPKRPHQIKALALSLGPDFMTDVVVVETADHARLSLKLSYNWQFDINKQSLEDSVKVFQVPDFVGDSCKAIAARVRGAVASVTFDNFHKNSAMLVHTVRTHCGANDDAFRCVSQEQDEKGKSGIALSKNLMVIAGEALKANIKTLGPLVLPISEQLLFFMSIIKRKLLSKKIKPYIPNFKLAFEHFCIHAGGRAVIDELEKNLQLLPVHVEASRMTLYRFGNTSSSSIWYELAYIEAKGRMRKGHRVWQIAFGSGFKCNSVTWKALQNVKSLHHNPWADCIHRYPVQNM